jgi:hypothetical protein
MLLRAFLSLLFIVLLTPLTAGITTVTNQVSGAPATNNPGIGSGSSFSLQDPQYSYMVANPSEASPKLATRINIEKIDLIQ